METKEFKLMIREAGNTQNPALIVLREKGYTLWIQPDEDDESEYADWRAEKDGRQFSATDPNALLVLVSMQEWRGDDCGVRDHNQIYRMNACGRYAPSTPYMIGPRFLLLLHQKAERR